MNDWIVIHSVLVDERGEQIIMACDNYNVGAIFDVSVVGTGGLGQAVVNTYQLIYQNGPTIDIDDVIDDVKDYMDGLYQLVKVVCSVYQAWQGFRVAELDGQCATGLINFDAEIEGQSPGNQLPGEASALVSMPTGIKRVVLRKYFGTMGVEYLLGDGRFSAAMRTGLQPAVDYLMAPQVVNTRTWRYGYKSPKTGGMVFPRSASISLFAGSQDRRNRAND